MFKASKNEIEFKNVPFIEMKCIDNLNLASMPYEDVTFTSSVTLVIQYLESLLYATTGQCRICKECKESIYSRACILANAKDGAWLALDEVLNAVIDLGYASQSKAVYFNTVESLRYYMDQHRVAIVELALTDTTKNAHAFDIELPASKLSDDYTKGFIAYKMDDQHVILQNTLGISSGIAGFNRMTIDTLSHLFVKGACLVQDWRME